MKYYLFLFAILSLLTAANAQKNAPTAVQAPGKVSLFFEKPYLHTDRETYVAGDDIWFKAYLVNAKTHQPLETSKNLYVELISPFSEILHRLTIRIDGGTGAGDIKLREAIPKGTYRLRAYTNWMRNFGDNFIFEKEITIHSRHKTAEEVVALASAAPVPARNSLDMGITGPYTRVTPAERIVFFPEGGSLVTGVMSLVAFKAEDARGETVKVSGSVYTSAGDTISRFESTDLGVGTFMLQPEAGLTYHVKGKFASALPFSAKLPNALPGGLTLRVTEADSATLLLTVSTNQQFLQEQQGQEMLLIGRHANERHLTVPFTLKSLQSFYKVPKKMLPAGLTAITLYDKELKPHCERLVFIPERESTTLTIKPGKATFQPKSQVTVRVQAFDNNRQPVKANLSVAVVDAGVMLPNEFDIRSYFLLQSEVRGKIQQPGQYFDPQNKGRYRQLDLLLLTQGWRDFTWKRIADTTHTIRYLPEQGFTVSGRVRQQFRDHPLTGTNITLTAFRAKGQKLYSEKSDDNGRFFFDGLQLYGKQTIAVNAYKNRGGKGGMLKLDSLVANPLPVKEVPLLKMPDSDAFLATQQEVMLRRNTMNRYRLTDTVLLGEVEVNASKVLKMRDGNTAIGTGMPDRVYNINPKDYPMETIRQFVNMHIPEDYVRGEGQVRFLLSNNPAQLEGDHELDEDELDTRNVHNREAIYAIRLDKVKRLTLRQMMDMNSKIIYVLLIEAAPDVLQTPDSHIATIRVEGYYEARVFYSPNYDARDNPAIPDMRTTIFWKHTLQTDDNGEATFTYFNADPATRIRIVAEGITAEGKVLVGTAGYQVK